MPEKQNGLNCVPKWVWLVLLAVGGGGFGGGTFLNSQSGVDFEQIEEQTQDLWDWHNVNDQEGVKLWYVRRSLEDAIKDLSEAIQIQTNVLREIHQEQKAIRRDLESN